MITFNRFVAASGLATAIICAAGWASASPLPRPAKLVDDPAFIAAQADLKAAPSFCALTYIKADRTRGYVAVCVLAE